MLVLFCGTDCNSGCCLFWDVQQFQLNIKTMRLVAPGLEIEKPSTKSLRFYDFGSHLGIKSQ